MRLIFRMITGFAGLLAVFLLLTFAIVKLQMGSFHRMAVGPVPRASMPVLVVDRDLEGRPVDAQIVRYRELEALPRVKYDRTFEVRANEDRRINDLIAAGCRRQSDGKPGNDTIRRPGTVRREAGTSNPLMRVEDTSNSDHVRVGWYMPDGRAIVALSYQYYFGPGLVLMSGAYSAAVCFLIVLIAAVVAARRSLMPRPLLPPISNP